MSEDLKGEPGEYEGFKEIKIPVPWGYVSGKWWGPSGKQPVLALHGWQDNAGTWDNLIPLLPKNLSYLAIDLPGHGLSSHYPPGQVYYLWWDGVFLIRRIVQHFGWTNICLLGHSLGGAIAFLYSSSFPEEVSKLIQVDIVSPTVRDEVTAVFTTSQCVERFLKYEKLTFDNMPCYSYDEMLSLVEDAYKGSVTRESCEVLLKRGMKPSPKGQGYLFSRDLRLKVAGLAFLSLDLVLEYASNVRCQVLNVRGDPGMSFDKPEYYQMVLDKMKENTSVDAKTVPGTHHLHLNTPERISGMITDFLLNKTQSNVNGLNGSGSQ